MSGHCCTDPVATQATALLGCLNEALAACSLPVCRSSLVAGVDVVDDVCCDCCAEDGTPANGQAWVRVVRVWPTSQFPSPLSDPTLCHFAWAAEYELGVTRCAPSMDENGNPPCAEDLSAYALRTLADATSMRSALTCCFAETEAAEDECATWLAGNYEPRGPMGGCGGGTQRVTVQFFGRRCTDPVPDPAPGGEPGGGVRGDR